jgi:hypothetical protein
LLLMVQDLSRSPPHTCQDKLDPPHQLSWGVRKRSYNIQCPQTDMTLIQFHLHLHNLQYFCSIHILKVNP